MLNVLEDLVSLARQRKVKPIDGSYTNKLLKDKNLSKEVLPTPFDPIKHVMLPFLAFIETSNKIWEEP